MIHQFVPRLEWGAVGAHVLELQKLAAEMSGAPSEIFVGTASPALASRGRPYRDYGRRVAAEHGDVLIYQSAIGSPVADFVLRRRHRTLVVNSHNLTPVRYLRGWDPEATDGVLWGEQQLRRLAPEAALAIAVSAYNAEHLHAAGYSAPSVVQAPVLVDLDGLAAASDPASDARLAAAKADGGADWLFVGRLSANKAQHRLVGALAAYRRLYDPKARLWLVGGEDGSRYGRAVKAFAQAQGLGQAVNLIGSVPPPVLAAHYRQADVFVCLSEHEGFCVPLVEAMHHGVPVVAYGSSAVPETMQGAGIVLAGHTGRPPTVSVVAAAAHRAVADPALGAKLRAAGRRRAAELSLDRTGQRYRDHLRTVLGP